MNFGQSRVKRKDLARKTAKQALNAKIVGNGCIIELEGGQKSLMGPTAEYLEAYGNTRS